MLYVLSYEIKMNVMSWHTEQDDITFKQTIPLQLHSWCSGLRSTWSTKKKIVISEATIQIDMVVIPKGYNVLEELLRTLNLTLTLTKIIRIHHLGTMALLFKIPCDGPKCWSKGHFVQWFNFDSMTYCCKTLCSVRHA